MERQRQQLEDASFRKDSTAPKQQHQQLIILGKIKQPTASTGLSHRTQTSTAVENHSKQQKTFWIEMIWKEGRPTVLCIWRNAERMPCSLCHIVLYDASFVQECRFRHYVVHGQWGHANTTPMEQVICQVVSYLILFDHESRLM
jgi:hypothetical protein